MPPASLPLLAKLSAVVPRWSERLRLKKTRGELLVSVARGSAVPGIIMVSPPQRNPPKKTYHTIFHLFNALPIELQSQIWEYVVAENTIEIQWKYFWGSHLRKDALQIDRAFMRSMCLKPNTVFSGLFSFFMPQRRYALRTCRLSRVVVLRALKREVAAMPVLHGYENMPAALTWGKGEITGVLQHLVDRLENPGVELKRALGPDHDKRADAFKQAILSLN